MLELRALRARSAPALNTPALNRVGVGLALTQRSDHQPGCRPGVLPPRRRAQRLSYAIWAVIGGEGAEQQPLLEADSTADRLRIALRRMRDVAAQLR